MSKASIRSGRNIRACTTSSRQPPHRVVAQNAGNMHWDRRIGTSPGKPDVACKVRAYDAHTCMYVCRVEIVRPDAARHDMCRFICKLEKREGGGGGEESGGRDKTHGGKGCVSLIKSRRLLYHSFKPCKSHALHSIIKTLIPPLSSPPPPI